ncbi:MAG: transcription factor FapR [Candidatus Fermentithermobacillus carboniphilus]|uniref:Transcription factor FapR n=1 Tax=Candidatus Fermentithermobacillus carboniphilus TaxID=3085328 RepID=A0AAT9LC71_9FIRM|nr:MAG: transcription factor FapR [Candidatus Fermentithermobacillus carboniphilus]
MSLNPRERRERLKEMLATNPFLSDRRLARHFGVSIQTIRLDRMALGIPDQRTRTKEVAERVYGRVRSLGQREIVGELIDVDLGKTAISVMEVSPEMAFERTGIARSHYIFAQADSLAICLIDAQNVVTGIANLKFKRPAKVGEKLIAKAQVIRVKGNKSVVLVETRSQGELVFRGKFLVFALDERGNPA